MSWPVACTLYAWLAPHNVPVGLLTLAREMAASTSSRPMPRAASARGSTCTRTAYFCEPKIVTCATPLTVEMRWARNVCAYSSTVYSGCVGELGDRYR